MVFSVDFQEFLGVSNGLPCCRIVRVDHGCCIGRNGPFWFVEDFEHADAAEIAVCVDFLTYPFEKMVGSVVLFVVVEAGRRDHLRVIGRQ